MTDRQLSAVFAMFILSVVLSGLLFAISVDRARANVQVSRALEHEMSKYACTTQDSGTVVYTKTEDDAELVAQISDVLTGESAQIDISIPVYNEVSIDDWLTIAGLDATNSQTIYVAGQGSTYAPSNTQIITRERPAVVETNGGWAITFGD